MDSCPKGTQPNLNGLEAWRRTSTVSWGWGVWNYCGQIKHFKGRRAFLTCPENNRVAPVGTKKTTKIFYPDEHTWGRDPGLSHCSHMQSATQSWHLQRTVWLSEPGMASDVVPAGGDAPSRCTAASGEEAGTTPGSGGGRVLNGRGGEDGGGSRVPKKIWHEAPQFLLAQKKPEITFLHIFFSKL